MWVRVASPVHTFCMLATSFSGCCDNEVEINEDTGAFFCPCGTPFFPAYQVRQQQVRQRAAARFTSALDAARKRPST